MGSICFRGLHRHKLQSDAFQAVLVRPLTAGEPMTEAV